MHSPNKRAPTVAERRHIERVKALPCSVCDKPGPSDCHEVRQGLWFASVALCKECHTGRGGIHGEKTMWKIRKVDELGALATTVERLAA
jgi:hypothetical protein